VTSRGVPKAACDSEKLFRKPPVILQIVMKAGYAMYTGENRPMTARTIFRINECFQRSKEKLFEFFFFFPIQPKNFETIYSFTGVLI
jgi:hypothetical protein